MVERFCETEANQKHQWFVGTGNLPQTLSNFLRTQDCFEHQLPSPRLNVRFSCCEMPSGVTIVGHVGSIPPEVTFKDLPISLSPGAEYRITPQCVSPLAKGPFLNYPSRYVYKAVSSELPFAWDQRVGGFRAMTPQSEQKWPLTGQQSPTSFDMVQASKKAKMLVTDVTLRVQTNFPGNVQHELESRYILRLQMTPPATRVNPFLREPPRVSNPNEPSSTENARTGFGKPHATVLPERRGKPPVASGHETPTTPEADVVCANVTYSPPWVPFHADTPAPTRGNLDERPTNGAATVSNGLAHGNIAALQCSVLGIGSAGPRGSPATSTMSNASRRSTVCCQKPTEDGGSQIETEARDLLPAGFSGWLKMSTEDVRLTVDLDSSPTISIRVSEPSKTEETLKIDAAGISPSKRKTSGLVTPSASDNKINPPSVFGTRSAGKRARTHSLDENDSAIGLSPRSSVSDWEEDLIPLLSDHITPIIGAAHNHGVQRGISTFARRDTIAPEILDACGNAQPEAGPSRECEGGVPVDRLLPLTIGNNRRLDLQRVPQAACAMQSKDTAALDLVPCGLITPPKETNTRAVCSGCRVRAKSQDGGKTDERTTKKMKKGTLLSTQQQIQDNYQEFLQRKGKQRAQPPSDTDSEARAFARALLDTDSETSQMGWSDMGSDSTADASSED